MIYREKLLFTEKTYYLPRKIYYLPRKTIIYREMVWFSEKRYYLPRKSMIYRENLWFTEKLKKTKMPLRYVFLKRTEF